VPAAAAIAAAAAETEKKESANMGKGTIGIIGAMDNEIELLKRSMDVESTETLTGMTFYRGTIGGRPVVLVRCGIGKVNAGLCVQILCDLFGVTHVINTGVAGSLDNEINVGDVVISIDAMYHDMDVTGLGYEPGQIPQMDVLAFAADDKLREAAVKACREAAPDIGVFEGRVVSGDQFICDRVKKEIIKKTFGGLCTEMEGAAVAQAAHINGIPYVIVRAISDKADESIIVSYAEFEEKAAVHCAASVEHLVKSLVKNMGTPC
jgi:adenosylhomocysteine nucleosidase